MVIFPLYYSSKKQQQHKPTTKTQVWKELIQSPYFCQYRLKIYRAHSQPILKASQQIYSGCENFCIITGFDQKSQSLLISPTWVIHLIVTYHLVTYLIDCWPQCYRTVSATIFCSFSLTLVLQACPYDPAH